MSALLSKSAVAAILTAVCAVPVVALQGGPSDFEVASVRESAPGQRMSFSVRPGGRLQIRGHNLKWLIAKAHGVGFHRVLEGPGWSGRQRFDIEAILGNAWPGDESRVAAMLRNLLAERFALRVRVEEQEMPYYALVLANPGDVLGDGIRPSTTDCDAWRARQEREGPPTTVVFGYRVGASGTPRRAA